MLNIDSAGIVIAVRIIMTYSELGMIIDGKFIGPSGRDCEPVRNPADDSVIGMLPHATKNDLESAVQSANRAFVSWSKVSPLYRSNVLRRVGALIRERAHAIARNITLDEGKPIREALAEVLGCAEHAEWHAEEARRIYGRIIPARRRGVYQGVVREPVGVCAAFSPWNFPFNQALRKSVAALGSGCTLILKGPENSPSAVMALERLFADAGLPPGCLNIVWGNPGEISEYLLNSPDIQKISFTGSTRVGKQLASKAGATMKRMTFELGGHAPVLVFDDADVVDAVDHLVTMKARNAGQVCMAPSRFFVQEGVYKNFVDAFVSRFQQLKLGPGLEEATQMGPLAHARRLDVMDEFVDDALSLGGRLECGGRRIPGNPGYFYEPTVICGTSPESKLMKDEIFGPIVPVVPFAKFEEGISLANATRYGLASFVFTKSLETAHDASEGIQAGMVSINHFGLAVPETPLGGMKDSGVGSEGGIETFDGYLNTKFVSIEFSKEKPM